MFFPPDPHASSRGRTCPPWEEFGNSSSTFGNLWSGKFVSGSQFIIKSAATGFCPGEGEGHRAEKKWQVVFHFWIGGVLGINLIRPGPRKLDGSVRSELGGRVRLEKWDCQGLGFKINICTYTFKDSLKDFFSWCYLPKLCGVLQISIGSDTTINLSALLQKYILWYRGAQNTIRSNSYMSVKIHECASVTTVEAAILDRYSTHLVKVETILWWNRW